MTQRRRLAALASLLGVSAWACSQAPARNDSPDGAAVGQDDGGTLVAQCQALAMTFVQNCHDEFSGDALTPDTQRECMWTTYGQICRTGKAQLLLDSMKSFGENK